MQDNLTAYCMNRVSRGLVAVSTPREILEVKDVLTKQLGNNFTAYLDIKRGSFSIFAYVFEIVLYSGTKGVKQKYLLCISV